jgi:hypothetical protein
VIHELTAADWTPAHPFTVAFIIILGECSALGECYVSALPECSPAALSDGTHPNVCFDVAILVPFFFF